MQSLSAGGYVDFSRFSTMRAQAATDQDAAIANVADEFEAMFVDLMLKAARKAEIEGGLFDSNALTTYREMFDQQIAQTLARNNDLGIGRIMAAQMAELRGSEARPLPGDGVAELAGPAPFSQLRRYHGQLPVTPPATDRPAQFKQKLSPYAEQAGRELGVSARAILAQAALETGWGEHVMRRADGRSSHNYFGIKAGAGWRGDVVAVPTTEYIDGRARTVNAEFRAYANAAEAFRDYTRFIADNPRYREVLASGTNEAQFAEQLAVAGYATDPRYAEKIIAILETGEWSSPAPLSRTGEH